MQKKNILKILGGNDKNIKLIKILGVVLVIFEPCIYGYQAQTQLSSISLKPKTCEDIYFPPGSGAKLSGGRILNTEQIFNNLLSV